MAWDRHYLATRHIVVAGFANLKVLSYPFITSQ
jgi:hypothetical protein